MKYTFLAILVALFISLNTHAQGHLFSEVRVKPANVYLGQPAEVTVAIYTSTWFTKGVNPGNIKVNGAFTVYFRSVSQTRSIKGKTYAGVEMIFNVFPYDDEDIVFPALNITVETPDVGDYKGKKRQVKTTPKTIKVMPVPPGVDKSKWLVSARVNVSEEWQGNISQIKVGDVIGRKITQKVFGMVAELIPPITWDSAVTISMYPVRPTVNTQRSKTNISATRTDGVRYLFEKEGEVIIPELIVSWWNPNQRKLFKHTIKAKTFTVLPNPDLGMLATLKDSLQLESHADIIDADQEVPFLTIKQLLIWLVSLVIIVVGGRRVFIRLRHWLEISYEKYRNSERYYFNQFKKVAGKGDYTVTGQFLYSWLDQLSLQEPTINHFIKTYGTQDLMQNYQAIKETIHGRGSGTVKINLSGWKAARTNYLRSQNTNIRVESSINP